jgi:hypothetical protein
MRLGARAKTKTAPIADIQIQDDRRESGGWIDFRPHLDAMLWASGDTTPAGFAELGEKEWLGSDLCFGFSHESPQEESE